MRYNIIQLNIFICYLILSYIIHVNIRVDIYQIFKLNGICFNVSRYSYYFLFVNAILIKVIQMQSLKADNIFGVHLFF